MKHRWLRANELECPLEGVLTIFVEGNHIIYDMGVTRVLVTDGCCPECGAKVDYAAHLNFRNQDKEDFELELLQEQENNGGE